MENKCKDIPDLQLSGFGIPKSTPEDVKNFVKVWENSLSKEQKDQILFFADNIYGFHLSSHEMKQRSSWSPSHSKDIENIAVFNWGHGDIRGEITVNF
jgi:hypothetical protein